MAMLKTVKRRKAIDLITEAASELHIIDQKYALQEDVSYLSEVLPSFVFQMPKVNKARFNAEKLQEWDLELLNLSIPSERKTNSANNVNHFQL